METSEIEISINKYNGKINTDFYEECLSYIKNFDKINKIDENKYVLESVRINLLHNDYNLYICDKTDLTKKIKENICWREYELSKNAIINMFKQINTIEQGDLSLLWCGTNDYPFVIPVFVISKKSLDIKNSICIKKKIEIANLLLGVESIKVFEHQDLKRFCNYNLEERVDIKESMKMFIQFYNFYYSLDYCIRERIIIFSGMVLHSLGTTYTRDADLIYNGINQSSNQIEKVKEIFDNFNKEFDDKLDYHLINDNKIIKSYETKEYLFNWIYTIWPNLSGKKNMIEVMADPEYHYYFVGIKMIGIDLTIKRLIRRASSSSFVDLLMLKKINNYDNDVCFPNLSIRGGKITIYTDKEINKKLNIIQKYFKEWQDRKSVV